MMPSAEFDAKIAAITRYYEPLLQEAAGRRDYDEFDRLRTARENAWAQVRAECFGCIA